MKPTDIIPGNVYQPVQGKGKWTYNFTYVYPAGPQTVTCGINYVTAAEAKLAMRHEVNRLRIKYSIIGANPYGK